MKKYSLKELERAVGGEIEFCGNATSFDTVCIDSRNITPGDVFFALKGEVSDGHEYIEDACKRGAGAVVVSERNIVSGASRIRVKDTLEALRLLAKDCIKDFDIPFVAVTGSSGKTTTKDIVAGVLSAKYRVYKTQGNLNSTTGVPLTLFGLTDAYEIAVIEVSMSHPGEILKNADILRPETALITNIGTCHMEFLKTRENIFKAKSEILAYLREGDTAVVNGDDDYLSQLQSGDYGVVKVGFGDCDYTAKEIIQTAQGVCFKTNVYGKEESFVFSVPGAHNVINCLMAIAVAVKYGMTAEEIRQGLKLFRPSDNRMEIVRTKGIMLINDTYNANPEAVKAALGTLCALAQARKIAVLGDMYELGNHSETLHEACGKYAGEQNIDLLLTFGVFGNNYRKGFMQSACRGRCLVFENKKDICEYLKKNLIIGDAVLFKASHSVKLEEAFLSVKGIL